MGKKRKMTGSVFADTFSGRWWVITSMFFPICICWSVIEGDGMSEYHIVWFHLIVSSGAAMATLLFWFIRPNPFVGDMVHIQRVDKLSEEDRKVLTFWKTSNELTNLILKSAGKLCLILLFMMIVAGTIHMLSSKGFAVRFDKKGVEAAFISAILYFFFSLNMYLYFFAHYLHNNIDRIRKMDIKSWPKDIPYTPRPYRNLEVLREIRIPEQVGSTAKQKKQLILPQPFQPRQDPEMSSAPGSTVLRAIFTMRPWSSIWMAILD